MRVVVYFEGGGDSRMGKDQARIGLGQLLEKAGFRGRVTVVAYGSRGQTFERWKSDRTQSGADERIILLVDSEGPVKGAKWPHVALRVGDQWEKPGDADEDDVWFMEQCMEAWIAADPDALGEYYGKCLQKNALPQRANTDEEPKDQLIGKLEHATRACPEGKRYAKGRASFAALGQINPNRARGRSRSLDAFLSHLANVVGAPRP